MAIARKGFLTDDPSFGLTPIIGVDEAGRGPLAGPVAVAAVILDPVRRIDGLGDSKAIPEARRIVLAALIRAQALAWHVEWVAVDEIDRINILQATLAGMRRAIEAVAVDGARALIDGNRLPGGLTLPAEAVVRGDARIAAIAAASILAKVARDEHLRALDAVHPGYGFAVHKGYPTPTHLQALMRLGPCAEHRRSFAPVRTALAPRLHDV